MVRIDAHSCGTSQGGSSIGLTYAKRTPHRKQDRGLGDLMAQVVNLDALIVREDFLATAGLDAGSAGKSEASRTDLTKGENFYLTLRKPDFQRETAAWTPEAVRDFVKAFIEGDLIPSVICWQSPARLTFVIDGAHRLSAIMAWLEDDYGDGDASIKFYGNNIPDEQRKVAERTRVLVNKAIGTWKDFRAESANPGSNPALTDKVRALAHSYIPLLWIKGQDSTKAERAFLTINRSAVQIDPTELKILNARFKPEAITARAIVRNATGHKYWKEFSSAGQEEIERIAREINKALYSPPLNPSVNTNELPIAGHGYGSQTLPLIFDFVNIANTLPVIDASKVRDIKLVEHGMPNEEETLAVMRKANALARRITGTHSASLGLLPAIYFYSLSGRHQPTSVLAMAALVMELDAGNKFIAFTDARDAFESFLIEHKPFINQLTVKHGSMAKGYKQQKDYLAFVLNLFIDHKTSDEVLEALKAHHSYRSLVKEPPIKTTKAKAFSSELKNWAFISNSIQNALKCDLCRARLDNKSMQLGHLKDRKDQGVGSGDNAAFEHPFCNSTYKPWLQSVGRL